MNNLPTVSIIIPTLNADRFLEGCLASIAKQDYPKEKIEIIIVLIALKVYLLQKILMVKVQSDGKRILRGKRIMKIVKQIRMLFTKHLSCLGLRSIILLKDGSRKQFRLIHSKNLLHYFELMLIGMIRHRFVLNPFMIKWLLGE